MADEPNSRNAQRLDIQNGGGLPRWNRRRVLSSTLAAGSLAGCLGSGENESSDTAVPTTTNSGDLKTVDTTERSGEDQAHVTGPPAEFDIGDDRYTISANGQLNAGGDLYGAIFADDAFGSGRSVQVTVDSQENTDPDARSGIMVANDITDPGGSVGDVVVAMTPENGPEIRWDADGDGYIDSRTAAGIESTFPITLRLERSGATFTGHYSTDGGESFTEIGSATIEAAGDQQDAGMFASSRSNNRSTVEFSGFELGSAPTPTATPSLSQEAHPLPGDAEALDRVVFGSAPSEEQHDFTPETSRVVRGTDDRIGRQITRHAPDSDAPPGDTIGSCSFTLDCDTDERVYVTVKAQQVVPDDTASRGLTLFHGDDQIGYTVPKNGPASLCGTRFGGQRVVTGDWVYFTLALPESLTEGRDTIELRLATYSPWGGDPIVHRAYTHTDELFSLPSDEEDTLGRDIGVPWGEGNDGDIDTAIATITENVEAAVESAQQRDQLDTPVAGFLARATTRNWIDTVDIDAIYESVRDSIDSAVLTQYEAGGASAGPFGRAWGAHGNWAAGFVKLSQEFQERGALEEPIPDYPEDITRREAYADFWESGWKWRDNNRRGITNQILIVADGLVSIANALDILAPDRAPSQEKVDAWIDQAIGIEPIQRLSGENEAGGNWSSGVFHELSEAGLNRETRYSAGYSLHPTLHLPKMVEDTGLDRIKDRAVDVLEGMGWFRWRGAMLDDNRRRVTMQAAYLGARGTAWPSFGAQRSWSGYGRAPAALDVLGSDSEIAKRWAELMIEDGAYFDSYDGHPERLYHMMHVCDGLRKLKDMEPSTYKLPWERDRAVFGDPDQAMVSITDGDVRLHVSLGHNHGTHAGDAVQFDYQGPNSHRAGTTTGLRRHEFPQDRTVERPNGVVYWNPDRDRWNIDNPYLPWRGERGSVNQHLASDDSPQSEVPIAGRPSGGSWPSGASHEGFTYFYREAQVGPYRIGINPTGDDEGEKRGFGPAQSFTMAVPESGAIDVATGEAVSGTVTVGPRETRVLKITDE